MVQTSSEPPAARPNPQGGSMLRYQLHEFSRDWIIPEEPVPESAWHDGCLDG